MKIKRLPAGFGYRMIVHQTVRFYTRNAYDWTVRLPAIAAAAERVKAKSFTIDGEAVVLGPDGWPVRRAPSSGRPRIARCCTPSI
jgi:ATP-dependent DNA ligase